MDDPTSKTAFRRELLLLREGLSPLAHHEKSTRISERLVLTAAFQSADSVHIYLSHGTEVGTDWVVQEAFRLKKRVVVPILTPSKKALFFSALPHYDPDLLEIGPFGIRQPQPAYQKRISRGAIDLWILPGVGFDLQGMRLGYGKGYYDRALEGLKAMTIGLAFDLQLVDRLPSEARDRAVAQIVTETRTVMCKEEKRERKPD